MKTRFLYWWDILSDQLWFIPTLMCAFTLTAALVTLRLDAHFGLGAPDSFLPSIGTTGASARIVLGSLIGALVTVLGLVFSITMLSVSQTTSQYGPRLVRLLFDTNVTQNTLGVFLGTIVYSMVVLRSIRDPLSPGGSFTPHLSTLLAEIACGLCVLVLLTFINHMTQRMRAETLIKSVYMDVLATLDQLFPEAVVSDEGDSTSLTTADNMGDDTWSIGDRLRSESTGYLQAIDVASLAELAQQHRTRLRLSVKPGHFIHEGTELATIRLDWAAKSADEEPNADSYRSHFLIGAVRTPRQDIEAGILELVEAGVRALSPGINDPMTAINVIDYLGDILRRLAQREWPKDVILDSDGTARVIVRTTTFPSMLAAALNQLRQNADGAVAVYCRLLESLLAVAEVASRSQDKQAIAHHSEMVYADAEHALHEQSDLADIRRRRDQVLQQLQHLNL